MKMNNLIKMSALIKCMVGYCLFSHMFIFMHDNIQSNFIRYMLIAVSFICMGIVFIKHRHTLYENYVKCAICCSLVSILITVFIPFHINIHLIILSIILVSMALFSRHLLKNENTAHQ